ncbi:hypothetical protein [Paraburkholderia fungorum]|uniref:hypothetical protein n=1 Tax=Paraburkholderia fungorum TaxID=134537 RepID=UPI0038B922A5
MMSVFIVSELPSQGGLLIVMWLRGFYRIARKKGGGVLPFAAALFGSPLAVAVSFLIGLLVFPLLVAYGGGPSLFAYWFISVPPVRGAPTFLCRRKEK